MGAPQQFTLSFEPSIPERFPTLREFLAYRAQAVVSKPMKSQAADMDMAPSTLSRKLNPGDGDTQRLNVDDLEAWLLSTGDAAAVVGYLAAKFMGNDESRKAQALQRLESLQRDMASVLETLRGSV